MIARMRTLVVALLVAVIAIRSSVSQPLSAAAARVAADPGAAVRHAADGWTAAGTLGGGSAQGIRELPLAAYYWLGAEIGWSPEVLQILWRVLVLVLAVVGAVRLARGLGGGRPRDPELDEAAESWSPWVAAALFGAGVVLVPTLVQSPMDGLAAATLPWIVAPLLNGGLGWRQAAASASWVGLAGVGSPYWAIGALGAGAAAALPPSRSDVVAALRCLVLALAASAWWITALAWEGKHAQDVSALTGGPGLREPVAEALDRPGLSLVLLLLVAVGPMFVSLTAVLLRDVVVNRRFIGALLVAGAVVLVIVLTGAWTPPVFAPVGSEPVAGVVGPVLGWFSLCGLVAWTPLGRHLLSRIRFADLGGFPAGRSDVVIVVVGAVVALTATAGALASVVEPVSAEGAPQGPWRELEAWSSTAPAGRVLVLPAESGDDLAAPIGRALGRRPWVGRDELPRSGAAATTALDDLLRRLARGDGGPGTASALRRLGISFVLVRLGGPVDADRSNPTALIRAALVAQDAERTAVLRSRAGSADASDSQMSDFGVRTATNQLEIWSLPAPADGWVYQGQPVDVVGDAGSVSDLADAGVLSTNAIRVRSASDSESVVLSDSPRRRDVDQRVPIDPYGPDLGSAESRSVVPADAAPVTTTAKKIDGARSVSASSTAADLDGDYRAAGTDATAAIDGNGFTAWQSQRGTARDQWWQVDLEGTPDLAGTSVQFLQNPISGYAVSRVRVETTRGASDHDVPANGLLVLDQLGRSKLLRITVLDVNGTTGARTSVGILEVRIPGVTLSQDLVVASAPTTAWLLAARTGSRTHCVPAVPMASDSDPSTLTTVCNDALAVSGPDSGSLDRVLTVDSPTSVTGRAWVAATDTGQAAALADEMARPSILATASSVASRDLVTRPQAAADADPSTAWRPASDDPNPALTLSWTEPSDVSGVRLVPTANQLASVPTLVRVTTEVEGRRGDPSTVVTTDVGVGADGSVDIPTVRTRKLTITVLQDTNLSSVDTFTAGVRPVPVAVAEVEVIGGPAVTYQSSETQHLDCGAGPVVSVDGRETDTELTVSRAGDRDRCSGAGVVV